MTKANHGLIETKMAAVKNPWLDAKQGQSLEKLAMSPLTLRGRLLADAVVHRLT